MKLFKVIYNLSILSIFILGILKFFQEEYYLSFIWIVVTPTLMLLPRNLYKIKWIYSKYNKNLIFIFEIFILILLFTSVGYTLGLKYLNIDFDSYSHLINLIIYTLIFGIIYYIIKNKITKKEIRKEEIAIFALLFSLIFGVFLWEKFQYYNDAVFGTSMYYDYHQDINLDTFLDKIFGSMGTLFGSIMIFFKFDDYINSLRK